MSDVPRSLVSLDGLRLSLIILFFGDCLFDRRWFRLDALIQFLSDLFTREASERSEVVVSYESILGISADVTMSVRPSVRSSAPPPWISTTTQPILMSEGSFDRAKKD